MNEDLMIVIVIFLLIGNFKIRINKFEFKFEGIISKLVSSIF